MKHFLGFVLSVFAASFLIVACGPSQAEQEARAAAEQARQDSIARAEEAAQRAADSIAQARDAERKAAMQAKFEADSAARAKLLPLFNVITNSGNRLTVRYQIKGTPTRHMQNSAYLSCNVIDGRTAELECNIDYCGSDWINPTLAVFTFGDENYEVQPSGEQNNSTHAINGEIICSEWFAASPLSSDLIDAIMAAKTGSVKIVGEDGSRTIKLSAKDIANMQKTIELYRLY